ncbi:uncharacterized protein ACRADG_001956 [Cochliomyia hominivorax]
MKLISTLIFGFIFTLCVCTTKAEVSKTDELTLRNQLFADVYFLKEGIDRLLINVEVLNKRYINQQGILKSLQDKLLGNGDDFEEENSVCDRITGMFNATFRKYNAFENRIVAKLDEIQDEQTSRLDDILARQRQNKKCSSEGISSTVLDTLTEVSEQIGKFEEKFVKLEALETKLNQQQTLFDKFVENQLNVLQEINSKLTKSEDQFAKISEELKTIKELKTNVKHVISNPRPKLPMEVILGLTSANVTSFN